MATTQYVITDVLTVPAVINEIKRQKGDILAINPEPTAPGKAPQKREVWFFCSKTAREILEAIGLWDDSIREPEWFVPGERKESRQMPPSNSNKFEIINISYLPGTRWVECQNCQRRRSTGVRLHHCCRCSTMDASSAGGQG